MYALTTIREHHLKFDIIFCYKLSMHSCMWVVKMNRRRFRKYVLWPVVIGLEAYI